MKAINGLLDVPARYRMSRGQRLSHNVKIFILCNRPVSREPETIQNKQKYTKVTRKYRKYKLNFTETSLWSADVAPVRHRGKTE